MPTQLKIEGVSIVLRGPFTPAVFQPRWLATLGLLREREAEDATVEVIHNDVAAFKAGWLAFQSTDDYLHVSTSEWSMIEPLRDFAIGILRIFPASQPIALGINVDLHYMVESRAAFDHVGNTLAPKERWTKLLPKPGMLSLTINYPRPDDLNGYINVKIEPSNRMPEGVVGVYVNINDHYDVRSISQTKNMDGNRSAQEIFQQHWQTSMDRSRSFGSMVAGIAEEAQ